MHIHTLEILGAQPWVACTGCDIALRLATAEEAKAIDDGGLWAEHGPMLGPTNIIAVPADYSLENT